LTLELAFVVAAAAPRSCASPSWWSWEAWSRRPRTMRGSRHT